MQIVSSLNAAQIVSSLNAAHADARTFPNPERSSPCVIGSRQANVVFLQRREPGTLSTFNGWALLQSHRETPTHACAEHGSGLGSQQEMSDELQRALSGCVHRSPPFGATCPQLSLTRNMARVRVVEDKYVKVRSVLCFHVLMPAVHFRLVTCDPIIHRRSGFVVLVGCSVRTRIANGLCLNNTMVPTRTHRRGRGVRVVRVQVSLECMFNCVLMCIAQQTSQRLRCHDTGAVTPQTMIWFFA